MMFKTVEGGSKISKEVYQKRVPDLRGALLDAQFSLKEKNIPVLIIISGVEGAGKGELINRLNSWMDTRGIETYVFTVQTDEERLRPDFWRFWKVMPPAGRIGIFFGSWYSNPILNKVLHNQTDWDFDRQMKHIRATENMLYHGGLVILKFWLHISKKEQGKRLKKLEKNKKTRFRVTKKDWEYHEKFEDFARISEKAIHSTDSFANRWHVIDAADERFRDVSVAEILLARMLEAINRKPGDFISEDLEANSNPVDYIPNAAKPVNILSRIDFSESLNESEYKKQLKKLSLKLEQHAWKSNQNKISNLLIFEGSDAAGKGGAIRRVIEALDAKIFRVIQIAAPTDEEKAQHYLWRFWRHIPRDGNITIYDRSWYGRVLVERVEGFARDEEWKRAYREINQFEEQLSLHGTRIIKFWLHITPEEQLKRFKDRENTGYKQYKITDEDWRNREKWMDYEDAVHEMVARTDTQFGRWHIIPSNNKNLARIKVLEALLRLMS